jgi:hypothetical protein
MRFADGAAAVRDRCAGLCEVCGRRPGVQTHHRQPRGMGGVAGVGLAVNRPSALVRVCLSCHAWAESERDAARVLGLLVPRPDVPAEAPVYLSPVYGPGWYLLNDEGCYEWWHGDTPTLPRAYLLHAMTIPS